MTDSDGSYCRWRRVTGCLVAYALALHGILVAFAGVPMTMTEYGRLLMAKIALSAAMLVVAAVNRLRLMPRLARPSEGKPCRDALHRLTRNSVIEIMLGFVIFAIVGALGTMLPAIHMLPPQRRSTRRGDCN
jgi:putative copper export protein